METKKPKKIRYAVVGRTIAVVQGVMATTLDVVLGIDLPSRNIRRILNLAKAQGVSGRHALEKVPLEGGKRLCRGRFRRIR